MNPKDELTPTEARLLQYLAANTGRTPNYEELIIHIWGPQAKLDEQALWVVIRRLRRKLEKNQ